MRLIVEYMGERRELRLREGPAIVGRDPSCDIAFPDPSLSRRHVECTLEGRHIRVRDLKTKNGTFLGTQRIEEARLPPGVPLRAGNVWLRFEAEAQEEAFAAPAAAPGELESRAEESETFEQDDEPTPDVGEPPLEAGTETDAARVVVRDGRWYLRDAQSGSEVEIVPVAQKPGAASDAGGAPSAQTMSGAQLPARIIRRDETLAAQPAMRPAASGWLGALLGDPKRRVRALVAALAGLIILLVAVTILHRPPKQIPLLTRDQYNQIADRAVALFRTDSAAALKQLQSLQQRPTEGNFKLGQILEEAFQADAEAVTNLEKGYEAAQAKWEEVSKSSESTDDAIQLARERSAWLQNQVTDLIYLGAARDAFKQGDYLRALDNAARLDKAGRYGKEGEALIQQATDAITSAATAAAGQMRWTDAEKLLDDLIQARPDLAGSLQPKISEYQRYETWRTSVDQAAQFVQDNKFTEAAALLESVGDGGPYAQQVAALRVKIRQNEALKNAQKAYDSGQGEQALDLLTKAGLGDSDLARRVRSVIAGKAKAAEAVQAGQFAVAKAAWEEILRTESVQTNAYAQEAKLNLDNMPKLLKDRAGDMVDHADLANQKKDYLTARDDYEEALRLDPTNKDARDGLARMAKVALVDFNVAIALPCDTLDEVNDVLQKLTAVQNRILMSNAIYAEVEEKIAEVQRLKARLEKPSGQAEP